MTVLCTLHDVTYEPILTNINVSMRAGARIGIVGINGAGKSTLLKLLAGELKPTAGHIEWFRKASTFYVSQEAQTFERPVPTNMREKWQMPATDYDVLSGGEKLKLRLAEAFAQKAQLLLLDEPTNHLDEASLQQLTTQLKRYRGTVVIVSHNRAFLDDVATEIWHVDDHQVERYNGNYTHFVEQYDAKIARQHKQYEQQKAEKARIESQLDQLSSWSEKAYRESTKQGGFKEYFRVKAKKMDNQVKSKEKRLQKELLKHEVTAPKVPHRVYFEFQQSEPTGKFLIELKAVSKSYGSRVIFNDVNATIQYGDRIALVGPNGAGKTTLLKMLLGQESYEGDIWCSPAANIGYLTQQVFDLPLDMTPSILFERPTFEQRAVVQTLMVQLGFTRAQWEEPIRDMSMGERVKCKLMQLILAQKNVLILDEPTNHLDLESREQLEHVLNEYNGTVIVVSHDRYFVEKTTSIQFKIVNQQLVTPSATIETSTEKQRMQLENRRQEVLGKLSFLTPNDADYDALDREFHALTIQINALK